MISRFLPQYGTSDRIIAFDTERWSFNADLQMTDD